MSITMPGWRQEPVLQLARKTATLGADSGAAHMAPLYPSCMCLLCLGWPVMRVALQMVQQAQEIRMLWPMLAFSEGALK